MHVRANLLKSQIIRMHFTPSDMVTLFNIFVICNRDSLIDFYSVHHLNPMTFDL